MRKFLLSVERQEPQLSQVKDEDPALKKRRTIAMQQQVVESGLIDLREDSGGDGKDGDGASADHELAIAVENDGGHDGESDGAVSDDGGEKRDVKPAIARAHSTAAQRFVDDVHEEAPPPPWTPDTPGPWSTLAEKPAIKTLAACLAARPGEAV